MGCDYCVSCMGIGVGCDCIISCIGFMDSMIPSLGNGPSSIVVVALICRWDTGVLGIIGSLNCAT